ncbi:hypothetical protein J6590_099256 [Homalodisca vitripennis]|nr:hypothetical protein J6590_099256 [Homalodisca vitripennis]
MCVYTDADGSRRYRTDFLQDLPTPGTGPSFDTSIPSNLTGLVGKTAYLNCRVKNLGNRTRYETEGLDSDPTVWQIFRGIPEDICVPSSHCRYFQL